MHIVLCNLLVTYSQYFGIEDCLHNPYLSTLDDVGKYFPELIVERV